MTMYHTDFSLSILIVVFFFFSAHRKTDRNRIFGHPTFQKNPAKRSLVWGLGPKNRIVGNTVFSANSGIYGSGDPLWGALTNAYLLPGGQILKKSGLPKAVAF